MSDAQALAAEILADEDSGAAATLLEEGEIDGLDQATLDKLVRCALTDMMADPYYFRIMDLVSPEVLEAMSADVGTNSAADDVKKILKDERSASQRDVIMRAAIESYANFNDMDDLFEETIGLVSADVQKDMVATICGTENGAQTIINMLIDEDSGPYRRAVAQAVKDHGEWDNDDLATIIQEAGHLLDDATIVLLARAMQDEETAEAEPDEPVSEA